jgi:putative ATPase
MVRRWHKTEIELLRGDITEMATDAIVNAANEHLAHGAGVAGAIVRKGGRIIQEESNAWVRTHGRVPTGSAAITSGGR